MSKLRTLFYTIIVFMISQSYCLSLEIIGVISAGIGDISNQKMKNYPQAQKFILETLLLSKKNQMLKSYF